MKHKGQSHGCKAKDLWYGSRIHTHEHGWAQASVLGLRAQFPSLPPNKTLQNLEKKQQ